MNMRKIIAVLASVLMLFSVIPMGALSVSAADSILEGNFDDGNILFNGSATIEDGALHWDASTASWAHLTQGITVAANTDYVVSFKMKSNLTNAVTVKFMLHDWATQVSAEAVTPTSEWADYSVVLNSGENTSILFMIQTGVEASAGQQIYIDDFKIAEKAEELEVGVITNGDFENGAEGWTLNSSASVVDGALQLDNSGIWSEAAMQQFAVEVGTEYTLSWQSKRVSGNGAYLIFILKGDTSNHPTEGENWMNETSGNWVDNSITFTAQEDLLTLKWSSEVDNGGVILIDNIVLTATPKAEVGKILNGDFETGDATGWETWQSTTISADAAYTGAYGANIVGNGGWGGMLNQTFDIEDGKTYELSFWYKATSSGFNWSLTGTQSGTGYGSGWETKTAWTQITKTFIANGDTSIKLNFNGGNTAMTESAYIDDVVIKELKDPSFDGYITNGDFEIGKATPWTVYSGTAVDAVAAKDGDYGLYIKNPTGGWGGTAFQDFTVEVGKTYVVTLDAKAISNGQNIQIQNGGVNVDSAWFKTTEWTTLSFEFTATAANVRINICGGGTGANEEIYVDNVMVKQLIDPSFDGYITNGDFETGELHPWQRIWDTQVSASIIEGGLDSNYAVEVSAANGKLWGQLRQSIAVEPNTDYIATVWAKNSVGMSLLVKDGADTVDIKNAGAEAGDEWVMITNKFNSGDNTSVLVGVMCNTDTASGIFDNLSVALAPAHECDFVNEVEYVDATCDTDGYAVYACECGETKTEVITAYHNGNLEYTAAVEAIDCQNPGNIEYYYCPGCYEYFADANATEILNPWFIEITVDCVRPEDAADCATVPCEVCGNDTYGDGEHDVVACQGGVCGKCGDTIEGYGCQNYDTPICEDGSCSYCGAAIEGLGHENGAWAPCLEGECAYGCGLKYEPTADHVDEDGNNLCDVCYSCLAHADEDADGWCDHCYSHLDHADEDADGFCDTCWNEMPVVEIIHGDANGDGSVNNKDVACLQQYLAQWDVELDDASADANGDGSVNNKDVARLQQYLAQWDVVLGPEE